VKLIINAIRRYNMLKALIKEKKKTQQELANELGVHQTLISQWCCGKSKPSLAEALKLSKILGVPLEKIAECVSK
jgi:transcriptional regulator with XRE-family HTH domain